MDGMRVRPIGGTREGGLPLAQTMKSGRSSRLPVADATLVACIVRRRTDRGDSPCVLPGNPVAVSGSELAIGPDPVYVLTR